jgi:hypothetical protein
MFDFVKDFSVDEKGVIGPSSILIELSHFISDVYVMIHLPLALNRIVRILMPLPDRLAHISIRWRFPGALT